MTKPGIPGVRRRMRCLLCGQPAFRHWLTKKCPHCGEMGLLEERLAGRLVRKIRAQTKKGNR